MTALLPYLLVSSAVLLSPGSHRAVGSVLAITIRGIYEALPEYEYPSGFRRLLILPLPCGKYCLFEP